MLHTVLIIVAVIGIVGYVIGRQLIGEPIRGKRLIVLPLILTGIGALDLGHEHTHHVQAVDVVLIAIAGLLAAAIGAAQGAIMRLENRDGGLWGQLPVKGLWLWIALVASRGAVELVAHSAGAQVAGSTAPLLLVLGINRLAQAAVIAPRALAAGIPFAAEKDGSTFLAGPVGSASPRPATPRPATRDQQTPFNQPSQPAQDAAPSTPTWQTTGQQFAASLGQAFQDRRSQRRGRDRRR